MDKSLFEGKEHTATYAKYRPVAPPELVDNILQYLQEKIHTPLTCAVDVGCGTGQGTEILCPYFKHVLGTDISGNQIEQARLTAKGNINVEYKVAEAENIPVADESLELVTASQCFHWFDAEKFFSETKRVLRPNGVVALYAYMQPVLVTGDLSTDMKLYDHLMALYSGTLSSYFHPVRYMVDRRYKAVKMPFAETKRVDGIWENRTSSIADYVGQISSWSSLQTYKEQKGQDAGMKLMEDFTSRIMEILEVDTSPEDTVLKVETEFFLLMGRKS